MLTAKTRTLRLKVRPAKPIPGMRILGLRAGGAGDIVRQVEAGFAFKRFQKLQKATLLSRATIAHLVAIPQRTLARREAEGRLTPEESDRVLRASRVFDLAVDLFEGNVDAARKWLLSPQHGLGGAVPLEFASTEVGAREVENLIGRLEHGVIA